MNWKLFDQRNAVSIWLLFLFQCVNLLPFASSSSDKSSTFVGLDKPFASSVFSNIDHFPCITLYHRNGRIGGGTLDRDDTPTSRIVYWKNIVSPSYEDAQEQQDQDLGQGQDLGGDEEENVNSYVAVMTDLEYTTANMETLLALDEIGSSSLRGVLIVNHTVANTDDATDTFTSPASMYPQGYNTPSESLYQYTNNAYAWNPTGDSILLQDYYGIPTVFISNVDISSYIYKRSKGQSLTMDGTKVVATFNYYMGPDDSTSIECLSWKDTDDVWRPKCLPLGGNSIWSATGSPPPSPTKNEQDDIEEDNDWNARDVILLATGIDSTAAFHDASTGASTAASNIMTLLLTAYHIGTNISWETLDSFSKQIALGFFQGESYGFMGSRNFIKDQGYPGFQCDYSIGKGCMYPIRPTLNFQNLGNVAGMIAVDQVGVLETEKSLYVHADDNGEDLENIILQFSADYDDDGNGNGNNYEYNVVSSNVDDSIPPSPLTSLIELSEGAIGGVVLTGYDEAYINGVYESHFDSIANINIDLDAIQNAALLLARSGVAAAYLGDDDDANNNENAAQAAIDMIPDINTDDDDYNNLVENLYNCLFIDGMCSFWQKYTDTEQKK